MKQLIRITSIYGEEFVRVELRRTKDGVYTDKGWIPYEDIKYIDVLGVIEEESKNEEVA